MDEPDDGANLQLAQTREARVRPRPVRAREPFGRGALPDDRVAQGLYAERGEEFEVFGARVVAVRLELVEVAFADAVDCALDPAPKLGRRGGTRPLGLLSRHVRRPP